MSVLKYFLIWKSLTPLVDAVGGALAFFVAGVCIAVSGISETHRNAEV